MPKTATKKNELLVLRSSKFDNLSWMLHGFSTRNSGVSRTYKGKALNLGFTPHDSRAAVERNRELFLNALDGAQPRKAWSLISLKQIHSDLIHKVDLAGDTTLAGDGLITNAPGLAISIQTADCLPIILVDPKRKVVGVFHAGWRGTVKRMAEKGVGEMRRYYGCEPRNMLAAIGPGVHSCCYDVGDEVRTNFQSQFSYADSLFREVKDSDPIREKYPLLFLTARAPGHSQLPTKLFLDLNEANRRQLLDAGLTAKNIDSSFPCTACNTNLLFSYRAEKGITGRMMAAAGIRP